MPAGSDDSLTPKEILERLFEENARPIKSLLVRTAKEFFGDNFPKMEYNYGEMAGIEVDYDAESVLCQVIMTPEGLFMYNEELESEMEAKEEAEPSEYVRYAAQALKAMRKAKEHQKRCGCSCGSKH